MSNYTNTSKITCWNSPMFTIIVQYVSLNVYYNYIYLILNPFPPSRLRKYNLDKKNQFDDYSFGCLHHEFK